MIIEASDGQHRLVGTYPRLKRRLSLESRSILGVSIDLCPMKL